MVPNGEFKARYYFKKFDFSYNRNKSEYGLKGYRE